MKLMTTFLLEILSFLITWFGCTAILTNNLQFIVVFVGNVIQNWSLQ